MPETTTKQIIKTNVPILVEIRGTILDCVDPIIVTSVAANQVDLNFGYSKTTKRNGCQVENLEASKRILGAFC